MKYNKFEKNESYLDVTKAIWEIVSINEPSVKQCENWIDVAIKDETPKLVKTDSERVVQILQNLLLKSIQLSIKKGQIEIKCEVKSSQPESRICFSVNFYTSQPIPIQEQAHIFDIFDGQNDQIGLHVAKQLCNKLGGDVIMLSDGNRTTFSFTVSCVVEANQQTSNATNLVSTKVNNERSENIQLSEVLVLSTNVIDRLAIKFTLQSKLSLMDRVHFISSPMEMHDSFLEQAQTSSLQKGFAVLILDIVLKSKEIKKITNILKELQDRVDINYKPKVILLSAQVISDT